MGAMRPSIEGEAVAECWRAVRVHIHTCIAWTLFVVMPNHVHGILMAPCPPGNSGSARSRRGDGMRRPYERSRGSPVPARHPSPRSSAPSSQPPPRRINLLRGTPGAPIWQRGFYEHVIRTDADLERVREYIEANPIRWADDEENPNCIVL